MSLSGFILLKILVPRQQNFATRWVFLKHFLLCGVPCLPICIWNGTPESEVAKVCNHHECLPKWISEGGLHVHQAEKISSWLQIWCLAFFFESQFFFGVKVCFSTPPPKPLRLTTKKGHSMENCNLFLGKDSYHLHSQWEELLSCRGYPLVCSWDNTGCLERDGQCFTGIHQNLIWVQVPGA